MVLIPQIVEYVFVCNASSWHCRETVILLLMRHLNGASTCVAFTAQICEDKNANISVDGLVQFSCVMMLESGINFDCFFFF